MPVAAPHTPIFLSSETVIPSGAVNALRNEALRNPFDVPIEVMELRFHAIQEQNASGGTGLGGPNVAGDALKIRIKLGNLQLTNGLVPVWNCGRSENPTGELLLGVIYQAESVKRYYCQYDWKLARPLVIPPGMGLTIEASNTGLVLDPITFRASCLARVINRVLSPGDPVSVPWVAAWSSKQFQLGIEDVNSSRETDLVTPTGRPIWLHWFTGRMGTWFANSTGYNSDSLYPQQAFDLTQVRMRDSRGYPVIRDYTRWSTAFNPLTRSWVMDGKGFFVPADTYWIADVITTPIEVPLTLFSQASIGAVGSYEVAYGDIA